MALTKVWRRKYGAAASQRRRNHLRQIALAYLLAHPCTDCGEADPVVLDFDHRDRKEKRFNIAELIVDARGEQLLRDEIAKCDVRCANCHRRKTAKERGYYRFTAAAA